MYPKIHIFLGFFFSLALFLLITSIGIFGVLLIFLSSFLIDTDHYFYYVYKKKDWNLKKAYHWFVDVKTKYYSFPKHKRKKIYDCFCFFHGIEPIILFIILGFLLTHYFYFISIGMFFHLILDVFSDGVINKKDLRKTSVIYSFIKMRNSMFIEHV